ncbi:MAG: DUF393 domain-containing protein [Rhizobiales bacterium]|nr:DUF393 domain-containing protein [Hyphomicrobiales bacterium]
MTGSTHEPIIVFDAHCVLCSTNAQFVLRHDRRRHFKLATLQGATGAGLYRRFGLNPDNPDSLIVVEGDRLRRDSDAILSICEGLGWPWRALTVLRFLPRAVRDPLYRLIARNRYRLFGRRETCWVPRPEDRERVL